MSRKHSPITINGRTHEYHSDAEILSGNLNLPLKQLIDPQVEAHLFPHGGYLSERSEEYRLEGVINFRRAYTQVAGNPGRKDGHGWVTLNTTVIEDLNILEILTADRVVGQIITEHPLVGYTPEIRYLGTRFENLRIAGHPVGVELDLDLLGEKPGNDRPYASHAPFVERVKKQYDSILGRQDLPAKLREKYNQLSAKVGSREEVTCSLVKHLSGSHPGISFNHILEIPDFGTVELAKLTITHEDFGPAPHTNNQDPEVPTKTTVTLTMLDLNLGCPIDGEIGVGSGTTNGKTMP